ncbi:post-PEP-CTERM-1 domain-containing protein [Roseateles chitinivorans]|uniref:post-PEP-CTERM-1 domain-containing protein n=1 Tax=Roseateles chitinivorans TaxID=2917965 RepID=UPI003D668752
MITRISLGLAIAAALPLAAQAHEAAAPAAADASTVSTAPVASQDALVIVRDAETGKLRPATAEEHAALKALAPTARARVALRAAAISPQMKLHSSGAVGIRMTDEMASQSVIVRGADGKLIEACFASKEEAEAFIKSGGTLAKSALPTE